jgi:6-phosphogluconolactonase
VAADLVIVSSEAFARTAADYIAEAIRAAAGRSNSVSLALSGGRSPGPAYQHLSGLPDLPWKRVDIYFADERAVPPRHAESNHRLVTESLLSRLPGGVASVHRMEADRSDLARAAEEYEAVLPQHLDVLVLGMGEDGHTASLFPHHPAVSEERRRVLAVEVPNPPRWRMTITPPVLRAARATMMLVQGTRKAPAVARACRGPEAPIACPAQLARNGLWILDEEAASQLLSGAS